MKCDCAFIFLVFRHEDIEILSYTAQEQQAFDMSLPAPRGGTPASGNRLPDVNLDMGLEQPQEGGLSPPGVCI